MLNFAGKVAVVTGAAGNLGHTLVQAFIDRGASVALVDSDTDALEKIRTQLPPGAEIVTLGTDLITSAAVTLMVKQVLTRFGHIDILANITGGFTMGPLLHQTEDKDWDFMLDLNARTTFNCCRAVVPTMLAAGSGKIVNVSARAATEGKARMAPYCASKAAVITLTQSLAAEHKHAGITVNCVLPGTLDTPQNRAAMPDQDHERWVPTAALADVILFLASDAARCVTGAAIPVYGQS